MTKPDRGSSHDSARDESRASMPPLDPAVAKLFATTSFPEPSEEVHARLSRRISHAIAAADVAASMSPTSLAARSIALAATTFVLGGVVGAVATVALRSPPAPRIVYVERPPASALGPVATETAPIATTLPPIAPAPAPTVRAPSSTTASTSATSPADSLGVERRLLDGARATLGSGDAREALRQLHEHEQRFARGRLVEEREALVIQALANVGRADDARERARAFQSRWPTSVYLPAVNAALASIP